MPNAPVIEHGSNHACYRPVSDIVEMPHPACFVSSETYYATLFHELTHSTGHPKRLGRFHHDDQPSKQDYTIEELIAEMGAAFLCGHCGIEQPIIEQSAAYIAGWMHGLQKDHRMLITAGSKAQQAADYIIGKEEEA